MTCPTCDAVMTPLNHGICPKCEEFCGCSFSPTNAADYCKRHIPMTMRRRFNFATEPSRINHHRTFEPDDPAGVIKELREQITQLVREHEELVKENVRRHEEDMDINSKAMAEGRLEEIKNVKVVLANNFVNMPEDIREYIDRRIYKLRYDLKEYLNMENINLAMRSRIEDASYLDQPSASFAARKNHRPGLDFYEDGEGNR